MSEEGKERKSLIPRYPLSSLIIVLATVIFAYILGRMWGPAKPSSLNELNNITSILAVLVAVMAIIGFELFLNIQEALRKVERFDDKIDKIEDHIDELYRNIFQFYDYSSKIENTVSETLYILSLINIHLQIITILQQDERYQYGMSLVFSNATEVTAYASRLFKVYFDDVNWEINERKFKEALKTIEYMKGSLNETNADTYKMIFELRLNLARERIKRWSEVRGRISSGTLLYHRQPEEKNYFIITKRVQYLRRKLDLEEEIIKELDKALEEVKRIEKN